VRSVEAPVYDGTVGWRTWLDAVAGGAVARGGVSGPTLTNGYEDLTVLLAAILADEYRASTIVTNAACPFNGFVPSDRFTSAGLDHQAEVRTTMPSDRLEIRIESHRGQIERDFLRVDGIHGDHQIRSGFLQYAWRLDLYADLG